MPTEPAHVTAARTKAQARPLAAAVEHLDHLIFAINSVGPTNPRIKTEESAAVADVLRAMAEKPAPVSPALPVFLAVYIGCNNDVNGNPRRGWCVSDLRDPNAPMTWIDERDGSFPWPAFVVALGLPVVEGEDYWQARDRARPYVHETGRINVAPGEYRDARKLPRFGGAS